MPRPNFIEAINARYSKLVEEDLKDPQYRNKMKICFALTCLVFLVALIIVVNVRKEDTNDGITDPDVFEKMLEVTATNADDDDDSIKVNEASK